MRILAIETSCDETAVALLETKEKSKNIQVEVLGNGLLSQTGIHALLGGVVPMLAKREHSINLIPMLTVALQDAKVLKLKNKPTPFDVKTENKLRAIFTHEPELFEIFIEFIPTIVPPKIDAIAVTAGPGLEPALWVGINFAKALELVWKKPVLAINHMEGHILASLLKKQSNNKQQTKYILQIPELPILALLISGGHTELVASKKFGSYKIIGETRDDAVGEAFDKVARMLGLPYPGGPQISKLAEEARQKNIISTYALPRPMLHSDNLDFSFAGLKTAVLYTLKKIPNVTDSIKMQIALEFENAATETLIGKARKALIKTKAKTLTVGGGVIANKHIREELKKLIKKEFPNVNLFLPPIDLTTDNAIMIGLAGYFKFKKLKAGSPSEQLGRAGKKITASGNWRLDK